MKDYLFFDNASTTQCSETAVELMKRFASEDFGNPSSSHAFGQSAAKAIREARLFFAEHFRVQPDQIIFTGSGSESDNLAVYGVAMDALANRRANPSGPMPRVLASAIEHPAVRKTVQSLSAFGLDARLIPVDSAAQIDRKAYKEFLSSDTVLVSIQRVNNIVGSLLPVEELAQEAKSLVPGVIFHTDAVQAFGRVDIPVHGSAVDLVSVSGHKIHGPKGVGALVVLNRSLLKSGLRPLIWGGEQEGGFRSGTQNAGLIAGFHAAARETLEEQEDSRTHATRLRNRLRESLASLGLLKDSAKSPVHWNSPENSVPHIVSLSFPGYPSGPLAKLLEERGCLVSTGSACSSQKAEPDPVLSAMNLPAALRNSAIRISFSSCNQPADVDKLVKAIHESVQLMNQLLGGGRPSAK